MTRRPHIVLQGINYAPEHAGIAPYTTGLAEHLAGAGWQVDVLTGVTHYPSWVREDSSITGRLRREEHRAGVLVRRARHFIPARQTPARRFAYEASYALNSATTRWRATPDVIVSVVPTVLSAGLTAVKARRAGIPHVAWVQDLMGRAAAESGISGGARVAWAVSATESRILRGADQVVTIHDALSRVVMRLGVPSDRVAVIRNWVKDTMASRLSREQARKRLGWPLDRTVVLHAGNMGLKQGLDVVVRAANLVSEKDRIDFVLLGDGNQRRALLAQGEHKSALKFVDPLPLEEFNAALAASDVLLVTERPGVREMSMPSKLTSYFAAGRPIVAAVEASGGTASEIRSSEAGLLVPAGDQYLLLEAVRRLQGRPELARTLAAHGPDYARDVLRPEAALQAWESVLADVMRSSRSRAGAGWR